MIAAPLRDPRKLVCEPDVASWKGETGKELNKKKPQQLRRGRHVIRHHNNGTETTCKHLKAEFMMRYEMMRLAALYWSLLQFVTHDHPVVHMQSTIFLPRPHFITCHCSTFKGAIGCWSLSLVLLSHLTPVTHPSALPSWVVLHAQIHQRCPAVHRNSVSSASLAVKIKFPLSDEDVFHKKVMLPHTCK